MRRRTRISKTKRNKTKTSTEEDEEEEEEEESEAEDQEVKGNNKHTLITTAAFRCVQCGREVLLRNWKQLPGECLPLFFFYAAHV